MRRGAAAAVAALVAAAGCTAVEEDETATTTTVSDAPTTLPSAVEPTTTTLPPLPEVLPEHVALQELGVVDQPTALAARAGDPALYIAERAGRVRRIEITTTSRRRSGSTTPVTTQTFELQRSAVLDIASDVVAEGTEQGLLGLTFSPDGRRLYVAYTGTDSNQYLDEYQMEAEGPDADTRRELLVIPDFAPNHNGGQLAFGPDGFLYWGMGDGGGSGDPEDSGQDPSDLLGSILRIDPDVGPEGIEAGETYAIPDGNPFADGTGAPEVWSYGLRNPWRFSFDRLTGDLWIGDVGQNETEEIDLVLAGEGHPGQGANFGWSEMEGGERFGGGTPPPGAVGPIFTYGRDRGCSVTGGYVYRGRRVPQMMGAYVYGDYCQGEVRVIIQRDGQLVDERSLELSVPGLSSFGEDTDGELYALSLEGQVFRIVPAGS